MTPISIAKKESARFRKVIRMLGFTTTRYINGECNDYRGFHNGYEIIILQQPGGDWSFEINRIESYENYDTKIRCIFQALASIDAF